MLEEEQLEVLPTTILVDFVFDVSRFLLNASKKDVIFFKQNHLKPIYESFINDPSQSSIFVSKCIEEKDDDDDDDVQFTISRSLESVPNFISTMVIIKDKGYLVESIALQSQLQIIYLPFHTEKDIRSSFEKIRSLIAMGISPYFDSLLKVINQDCQNIEDDSGSIGLTKKRFNELVLSLQHIQQIIQVPDLKAAVHPKIKDIVAKHGNQGEPLIDFVDEEILADASLMNSLQATVNQWIRSVQDITHLSYDPQNGTSLDEVSFWVSLESALLSIEEQLNSPEILLTLDVLKMAKRFHATVSFLSDTGIKEALGVALKHSQLLKDIPLDELFSAPNLNKLTEAIILVCNHLKRLRIVQYPIIRAISFVEVISRDLEIIMRKLLLQPPIMSLTIEDFDQVIQELQTCFDAFDLSVKDFTNLARELLRKRNEKFIMVKVDSKTKNLLKKINLISQFRKKHIEWIDTIQKVNFEDQLMTELDFAYNAFEKIDVLDTSNEGSKAWDKAEKLYNQKIVKIQNTLIQMLRSLLSSAKTSNEMFEIFANFQFLLSQETIRNSIQEYQSQLLSVVKSDIKKLQVQFVKQIPVIRLFRLRDIPPVSSTIIWAKQIEQRLDFLISRCELILGLNWKDYPEGQKMNQELTVFRSKLNSDIIFEKWVRDSLHRTAKSVEELNVFEVTKNSKTSNYELIVAFDPSAMNLFKEVRYLRLLDYEIPTAIVANSNVVKKLYPHAVAITESLIIWTNSINEIENLGELATLLSFDLNQIINLISSVLPTMWGTLAKLYDLMQLVEIENHRLEEMDEMIILGKIILLEESISTFSRKIALVKSTGSILKGFFSELKNCDYDAITFQKLISSIQATTNEVVFNDFSDIEMLVSRLNEELISILTTRCLEELDLWGKTLTNGSNNDLMDDISSTNSSRFLLPLKYEIVVSDLTIKIIPSIELAKEYWYKSLHDCLNVVREQKLISSSSGIQEDTHLNYFQPDSIYVDINNKLNTLEAKYLEVSEYCTMWSNLQNLWSLELDSVFEAVSVDIDAWLLLLYDFKITRKQLDTFESSKDFGCIIFDYKRAQSHINNRYDLWQSQLFTKFAEVVGHSMKEFDHQVLSMKKHLEDFNLNDSILLISEIGAAQSKMSQLETDLKNFQAAAALLIRNRFRSNSNWLPLDQLNDDYAALEQILLSRQNYVQKEMSNILQRIEIASESLTESINQMKLKWDSEKPVTGDLIPDHALHVLLEFEKTMTQLETERTNIITSANIMNKHIRSIPSLSSSVQEISDLKSVWDSLNILWIQLENCREQPWTTISHTELRRQLDDLLSRSRSMPVKVRQYSAFEDVQTLIKNYMKGIKIISILSSESMKDHHWNKLFKNLNRSPIPLARLKLGDVWKLDILRNEQLINKVVEQANGEKAVEDELNKIETTWQSISYEFFNYKGKIRLVKKWDLLFEQCTDDINTLSSMQHSAHYEIFEQRGAYTIERLNKLFRLLDVWIEVQKQYVYVDGVFGEGSDIERLLPLETSRFQNLSAELFLLLKNIFKSHIVIDALNVPDVQRSMERIMDLLTKIRKSLSEYLEKQRELFPRFYFVGNGDLLDMIGNSHNPEAVSRHFGTLFSGMFGAVCEKNMIIAVTSEENEVVQLSQPVEVSQTTDLHSWLIELEYEVKVTLSKLVEDAIADLEKFYRDEVSEDDLAEFIDKYQLQIIILASQICFTKLAESSIEASDLKQLANKYVEFLQLMANAVLGKISSIQRRKHENLIIEFIHQRDIINNLVERNITLPSDFSWLSVQRFYYNHTKQDYTMRLTIEHGSASFTYGFEYLGVQNRLVYTPLIDSCFLSMTGALSQKIGGSPFGPAGTGKTESIKALGQNLGKMVLVFCCDESFDFQAMGRILLGICEVGAWACFDEFNRLDEKMLSAVSTQIEEIEVSLGDPSKQILLLGKKTSVHRETGIFITMNPGYAGRSELPENLKKLFRSFSMAKPDREIIAEVILNSQGFKEAKDLASKIVPFYLKLESSTTNQVHYDFGLRSLKIMLINCGLSKRDQKDIKYISELLIVLNSLNETVAPKLVQEDVMVYEKLELEVFGSKGSSNDNPEFLKHMELYSLEIGISNTNEFIKRALQLSRFQETHHGIILLGEAGVGKTTLWKATLAVLGKIKGEECTHYILDCKVMSKEQIYGSLDPVTRDWSDGLLTSILRKINENLRGELSRKIWIVFDGDVDPDWIENLNSVLDDNKTLTLPNGERISLPSNLRLIFEVDNLDYATPATISRCGIIYVSKPLCDLDQQFEKLLLELGNDNNINVEERSLVENTKSNFIKEIKKILNGDLLETLIQEAKCKSHIMIFDICHSLKKLQIMLGTYLSKLINKLTPLPDISKFSLNSILISCCWAFVGDCPNPERVLYSNFICDFFNRSHPEKSLIDYSVAIPEGGLELYRVPSITLEYQDVVRPDVVIPTTDTVKHEDLIYSVINEHAPLIMCGPPGSGKTMTLLSALRKSPDLELVDLNFSKETTPSLLLKTMELYCEYRRTANATILVPRASGRWLVVFADELNLPKTDKFNTQRVISFMREMIEKNGFYKNNQWVELSNIQFVGACNPPTDLGRYNLSMRFLRNTMVVSVNYPDADSLYQIYVTLIHTLLSSHNLPQFSKEFGRSLVEIYENVKNAFTNEVISPRDISRVVRGMYGYLEGPVTLRELLRLLLFNALRVYSDKASDESISSSIFTIIKNVITENFPIEDEALFKLPILYTNWFSTSYQEVSENDLRLFVSERLKVFCEEETDVAIVLYDSLLDHILRIDRVLKQHQGHLILVGPSSSGKSTLTKFVSWINGFKIVQLLTSRKFTLSDFDNQLREIIKRVTLLNEKLTFIIDESNIIESSFLERMNNLLSSCEIPGLFEEDEIKSISLNLGLEESELPTYMRSQIAANLHVIFTMSEAVDDAEAKFLSSPALINRCVVDWIGDWSDYSMYQVGLSITQSVAIDMPEYRKPSSLDCLIPKLLDSYRDVLIDTAVYFHRILSKLKGSVNFTPGNFLYFMMHFKRIYVSKENGLQAYQKHINSGLEKLRDTVLTVKQMKTDLSEKNSQLELKNTEANKVLGQMLAEQNEAERKREASIEIQIALEGQEKEIEERRITVMGDLELAEPAVIEALRGVKNIKKEHLNELKAMRNPPESVVLTLESVCSLLGYATASWRDVQLIIRGESFISDIVNFDNEKMCSPEMIAYMNQKYLSRPDYNFDTANRGSKACGPLLQWVEAQIQYALILDKISPLKKEVEALEYHTSQTKKKLMAVEGMIHDLEKSIEISKNGYSSLIRETEKIKSEMSLVEMKVERSVKLLNDLTNERDRWRGSVKNFHQERIHLVGDALLSAAFISYCGYFDHKRRSEFMKLWRNRLALLHINFDENFTIINYLSTPSKVSFWKTNGLENDDLFIENMILIENSEKCPFIIDPSGHIVEVLSAIRSPEKLTVTSFLDDTFIKQVENALRFGNSILIQDAEYFDPVLFPIIAKDFQRVGNRTLVRFGQQVLDLAPGFKLYITTKNHSFHIPSFIFSRCTVVNFTITESSVIAQSLNMTLQAKNPDVENQRVMLTNLSSEYKLHLRELEEDLLTSLSTSDGDILENDVILTTLQNLKSELNEISVKMAETEHVMSTVDNILDRYYPFALNCSKLFDLLQSLQTLSHLYQFSMKYFNQILVQVLATEVNTPSSRLEDLTLRLYREFYDRTSLSLLYKDKIVLAVSMFILYYETEEDFSFRQVFFEIKKFVCDEITLPDVLKNIADLIGVDSIDEDILVSKKDCFLQPVLSALPRLQKEPDALMHSFSKSTSFLFKSADIYHSSQTIEDVIKSHRNPAYPIILASSDSYDPSFEIKGKNLVTIAMGSNEGVEAANSQILQNAKNDGWLLLQNIQMSPKWLESLEQKLDHLSPTANFRLFLTCNLNSSVPVSLLKSSDILVYEISPGIKVLMEESYSSVLDRLTNATIEKRHLYFLLSWYHAAIQERMRFVPVGFTKKYDFNNTDFEAGVFLIDQFISKIAGDRTNIDPHLIPWEAFQVLIGQIIYGGKVDVKKDSDLLISLAEQVFVEASFADDFELADGLVVPEERNLSSYLEWIRKLPAVQPPSWIGLDPNIDQRVAYEDSVSILQKVHNLIV